MLLNCGVGEDSWESLDGKEIKPVHSKGNQSWILIGRTDAEAETPIFWRPDVKNWFIWKDPYAWKDWRQEEKGATEDEMVGWSHQLNGLSKFQEMVKDRGVWHAAVHGITKSRTWLRMSLDVYFWVLQLNRSFILCKFSKWLNISFLIWKRMMIISYTVVVNGYLIS